MHRPEQPIARAIAGEHPPGAVGAVGRRRQAEHQDPRLRIAEAGDRPTPVHLVAERRPLLDGDLLAPRDQPRAQATRTTTSAAT